MKWYLNFTGCLLLLTLTLVAQKKKPVHDQMGILELHISHSQNQVPLRIGDTFQNQLGQSFTLRKLKYYLSGFSISPVAATPSYYLVDIADSNSCTIRLKLRAGIYNKLYGRIGVDSAANCSGAQTGVLDPVHDMFWTWNTGYIQFKIEGDAESSSAPNGKMEYHIGGYRHPFNTIQQITLQPKSHMEIRAGRTTRMVLQMELYHFWEAAGISFSERPVVAVPGEQAVKLARAFKTCFQIID